MDFEVVPFCEPLQLRKLNGKKLNDVKSCSDVEQYHVYKALRLQQ